MSLSTVRQRIITCEKCPRLRRYCEKVAREKRASFRADVYWGRPVPGFGDPRARIVLVGLAPAAHGANRTGRIFTGDGVGGSGDFLMAALFANGLASQPFSRSADDGLRLKDTWMLATVRCAPPGNKPAPDEIANCREHLVNEVAALPRARVFVALGRIAFDACVRLLAPAPGGFTRSTRPAFAHGAVHRLSDGRWLIASYHPSRQNTHTGRLTPAMLQSVFRSALTAATRAG